LVHAPSWNEDDDAEPPLTIGRAIIDHCTSNWS
jgi:hypothetical protein